jgi:heme-degrading monooxygenase HmoA
MAIVETMTFRVAPASSDESFLAADRRLQGVLIPNQPGFMRRTTARRGENWLVVTLWATEPDAVAFARVAERHPVQVEFDLLVDPGSVVTNRYHTLD